jgi:HK97 family phage portal protein
MSRGPWPPSGGRNPFWDTRATANWPPGTDVDVRAGVVTRTATDGRDILENLPDGWEVDDPMIWWDGPAGGDGTGGPLGNPPPGAEFPNLPLPVAVTRATSLISDTLAGMPWKVRRDRELLPTPPWMSDPQALRRDLRIQGGPVPAWRRSRVEFWSWYITSMLWLGEGIAYVPNRNDDGSPAPPIWQLNPLFIDIDGPDYIIPGGVPLADELADGRMRVTPEYRFGPDELIVTRGLVRDGPRGVGVLQAHFQDLMLAGYIRDYAVNMLRLGVPNGYLKVTAPKLSPDQAKRLQRGWMRAHGSPWKSIAVLNAVTEFHPIGLDPAALQLAQMRDYSTADVALMFGVPAYMLNLSGAGTRDTYANVESRMIELRQFTLLPWAVRIEATVDAELARGTDSKIAMDALLRADTLSRYRAHQIGLGAGGSTPFLLRDEVREYEDLPDREAEFEALEASGPAVPAIFAGGGGNE